MCGCGDKKIFIRFAFRVSPLRLRRANPSTPTKLQSRKVSNFDTFFIYPYHKRVHFRTIQKNILIFGKIINIYYDNILANLHY